MSDVVKERTDAPEGFFEAEAAGLRWLASADGARVAEVVDVRPGRIVLERIHESRPDRAAARDFGARLAQTHDAGAAAFGAPSGEWDGPIFIGRLPQPTAKEATWGAFYGRDRVRFFLPRAVDAGNLTARDAAAAYEACDLIEQGVFDDDDAPARLHGDLWNGNVLWTPTTAVLIDPAAHGGHRETDLAMLALFGCPYLDEIVAAYDAEHALAPGSTERIPLHQLHPLAVHAVGHGPAYGSALGDAARRTLALAR